MESSARRQLPGQGCYSVPRGMQVSSQFKDEKCDILSNNSKYLYSPIRGCQMRDTRSGNGETTYGTYII